MKILKQVEETVTRVTSTVPDYQIDDRSSFDQTAREPIPRLYFFHTLDCLFDLAHAVSHDFYDRPEMFSKHTGLSDAFGRLRVRYGCDEAVLDKVQRTQIYTPLFGKRFSADLSGGEGDFPRLRNELLLACITYVEAKLVGDERTLLQQVKHKHGLFKGFLTTLFGESVDWSCHAVTKLAEPCAYTILRNEGVAAVYGVTAKPIDDWPYVLDNNGGKLVEKITQQLPLPERLEATADLIPGKYISREEITNLQRAAIEGAKTLATALCIGTHSNDSDYRLLAHKGYTWANALKSLIPFAVGKTLRSVTGPLYSALVEAASNYLPRVR